MSGLEADPVADWEARIAAFWKIAGTLSPQELVRSVDALAAERPADDAAATFERACARDSAGFEREAEPLYRAALGSELLDPYRRARAALQLGSTLRLLGRLDESEAQLLALRTHIDTQEDTPLRDELAALLALTWLAQGKAAAAAGLALEALAPHLSRYQRSVRTQARLLGGHAG